MGGWVPSFPHTHNTQHVRPYLLRFRRQGRRAHYRRPPRVRQARRREGQGEHVAGKCPVPLVRLSGSSSSATRFFLVDRAVANRDRRDRV